MFKFPFFFFCGKSLSVSIGARLVSKFFAARVVIKKPEELYGALGYKGVTGDRGSFFWRVVG